MAEIKEVPNEVKDEIESLIKQGISLLNISTNMEPKDVVAAITDFIRVCKETQKKLTEEQLYAIGALLGCQYVKGLQWHWGCVVWDFDEENGAIGVLNADNSLFNNPIGWVSEIMNSDGGVPFMLSYNMIVANKVPVFEMNSATPLY